MIIGKRIITATTELTILAAGDWPPAQVRVLRVPSTWQAGPPVRELIESEWAAAARPGVVLYDGPTCRLEGFSADASGLTLRLSEVSYKIFVTTNLMHPELADAYGPGVLANSLGVGTPVFSSDGFVIMGRRNQTVVWYPGRTHPFAGALEPGDGDPFVAGRRELHEEAALEDPDLLSIRCLGVVEDFSIRQPEVILRADVRLTRAQVESNVARDEHHAVHAIAATPGNIASAVNDPALTPAAVGALLLWGRSQWGDDWLEQTVKNHCAAG
jgi:8-oxo-dGTP pyrophosphatase MutT (NUDIX family)